jgi:hypothetical protein
MKNYIVYHNPKSMGYSAREINELSVVTNKNARSTEGNRVWILTGEGAPRKFYLVGTFIIRVVSASGHEKYSTRLSGTYGQLFKPIIDIGGEEWFQDLKRNMGNFAFGFQSIKKERFVRSLERACASQMPGFGSK